MTEILYLRGKGQTLTTRYSEMVDPKKVPEKTGDEIAFEVIVKLGLKPKEEGG